MSNLCRSTSSAILASLRRSRSRHAISDLRRGGRSGCVRFSSHDAPLIAPNYLATEDDKIVVADTVRVTRRLMRQPALVRYRPSEYLPGPQVGDDDASLARAARDIGTTIFHPVGTARMGTDNEPTAVVDERLRVRGIRGLRIIDASIMPTITSGNTNTLTAMIAEKGASMLLDDARQGGALAVPG